MKYRLQCTTTLTHLPVIIIITEETTSRHINIFFLFFFFLLLFFLLFFSRSSSTSSSTSYIIRNVINQFLPTGAAPPTLGFKRISAMSFSPRNLAKSIGQQGSTVLLVASRTYATRKTIKTPYLIDHSSIDLNTSVSK